jgi:hypothetical protein
VATLSSGAIRFPTLSGWWNESKLELRGLPFGELVSEPDSELSELLGRFLWPNVSVEFRGLPSGELVSELLSSVDLPALSLSSFGLRRLGFIFWDSVKSPGLSFLSCPLIIDIFFFIFLF